MQDYPKMKGNYNIKSFVRLLFMMQDYPKMKGNYNC